MKKLYLLIALMLFIFPASLGRTIYMKKLYLLIALMLFIFPASPGWCNFNIFLHRRVIVGDIDNPEGPTYEWLADSIGTQIYSYFLQVPFLTLTDRERAFLLERADEDEYRDAFIEARESIGYRITPRVERGPYTTKYWPIFIYGHFTVFSEEAIQLILYAHNGITDHYLAESSETLSMQQLLNEPQTWLVPFFRTLLKYKTHTLTVEAEPPDALIFIDGRSAGVGKAQDILLPAGRHVLAVRRDGYEDYRDMFTLTEDGHFIRAALQKVDISRGLYLETEPQGATIFVDENLMGQTPLFIPLSPESSMLTIAMEGFREESIAISDLWEKVHEEEEKKIHLSLLPKDLEKSVLDRAETLRKQAKILSYTGFGMLGVTIFLGVKKTLYDQKADLYRPINEDIYQQSARTARSLSALTYASSAVTGGAFIFSFIKLIKYFTLYNARTEPEGEKIRLSEKILKEGTAQ
jgi:hypothetical protein